jgi:hypothetical protein
MAPWSVLATLIFALFQAIMAAQTAEPAITIVAIVCYGFSPFARAAGGWAARAGNHRETRFPSDDSAQEDRPSAAMKSTP